MSRLKGIRGSLGTIGGGMNPAHIGDGTPVESRGVGEKKGKPWGGDVTQLNRGSWEQE